MRNIIAMATAAVASTAVIAIAGAAPVGAAPSTGAFGSAQKITDGNVVAAYTVTSPAPSSDNINVPIAGKLYAATATVEAVQGTVTPAIPFFNARSSSGDNYRVLWQAFAPGGLSGATLPQGGKATGKIYFDVTGAAPTSIVYNDAVQDRAIWGSSSSSSSSSSTTGYGAQTEAPAETG